MGWRTTRAFNPAAAGTAELYCLRNVRLGYGIASKYMNATEAWRNTQQHRDRNVPAGIAVPLFYTWGADGHINVRMPDGRVWSDGDYYRSIEDYEAKKEPNFVGWGESVNDVRVIDYAPDPVPGVSMPKVGDSIKLLPVDTRTTFVAGTTTVAGTIHVTDNTFIYQVRGFDPKYPGRVLINSKSGGGDGVALALRYTNGALIEGWKLI